MACLIIKLASSTIKGGGTLQKCTGLTTYVKAHSKSLVSTVTQANTRNDHTFHFPSNLMETGIICKRCHVISGVIS